MKFNFNRHISTNPVRTHRKPKKSLNRSVNESFDFNDLDIIDDDNTQAKIVNRIFEYLYEHEFKNMTGSKITVIKSEELTSWTMEMYGISESETDGYLFQGIVRLLYPDSNNTYGAVVFYTKSEFNEIVSRKIDIVISKNIPQELSNNMCKIMDFMLKQPNIIPGAIRELHSSDELELAYSDFPQLVQLLNLYNTDSISKLNLYLYNKLLSPSKIQDIMDGLKVKNSSLFEKIKLVGTNISDDIKVIVKIVVDIIKISECTAIITKYGKRLPKDKMIDSHADWSIQELTDEAKDSITIAGFMTNYSIYQLKRMGQYRTGYGSCALLYYNYKENSEKYKDKYYTLRTFLPDYITDTHIPMELVYAYLKYVYDYCKINHPEVISNLN